MAGEVYSYAPSAVKVSVFGLAVEGFSKDSVVNIERLEGSMSYRKANDGCRTAFLDRYGTYRVTVHLMQSSPSNTWLHQLYKVFQKLGSESKIPLTVHDGSNETDLDVFAATDVFFDDEPSTVYSSGPEVTEWTFICHDGRYTRVGAVDTYQLAENLSYLFAALDVADSLGFDLEELGEMTSSMLEKTKQVVSNLF